MKRRYLINDWEETREFFIRRLGDYTEAEYKTLISGGSIKRMDSYFRIENISGI